nr:28 kDa ribonucleoprotein, chloroplastic [Aegilops tauschii subsp. strangulata]
MGPQPRDGAESSSDPRDVVEISSDDGVSPVPAPRTRRKKGKDNSDDDDCVVLDGDPDKPLAVAGAKARTSGGDASDEVEIFAAKGQCATLLSNVNRLFAVGLARLVDSPPLDVVYPTTPSARKVRMENLPYHMDREDLPGLFYHAGIVVLSEILYDRETGQSLGRGLVTMNTVEEAEKAVELYHHSELCGRLVTVSKAAATGGRAEETPSPRRSVSSMFMLFVNNLSPEVDGCELKRLFSELGEVVHAKVIYHHTGARWESKEFGVVTMATREWLKDAIRGLNKVVRANNSLWCL